MDKGQISVTPVHIANDSEVLQHAAHPGDATVGNLYYFLSKKGILHVAINKCSLTLFLHYGIREK